MTYVQALDTASYTLKEVTLSHHQDALHLLTNVLGITREQFYAREKNATLTRQEIEELNDKLTEITAGKPLAQVLGQTEFMGNRFKITSDVLIPRPETEQLVEMLLNDLHNLPTKVTSILEVGMGSGCIIASLGDKLAKISTPEMHLVGIEPSLAAYQLACANIEHILGTSLTGEGKVRECRAEDLRITCVNQGIDDFQHLDFHPQIIIANPPYITSSEYSQLDASVRDYEPRIALDGGIDGLDVYRSIIGFAGMLPRKPKIYLELSPTISDSLASILRENGYDCEINNDLFGRVRFAVASPRS